MAKYFAEGYHWFRMYYLSRYGIPIDGLDLLYRLTLAQTDILFSSITIRYQAKNEEWERMTPRERYIRKLQQGVRK